MLAIIIIPGGYFAIASGMNKLDTISQKVDGAVIEIERIKGDVRRIESSFGDYRGLTTERRSEREEDLRDIRADVRSIKADISKLSIAVERIRR